MEQNHCPRRYAPHDMDEGKCLKRNDAGLHQPHETTCHDFGCGNPDADDDDDLRVGFLYEIDHKRLPPKYPIQLKSIRVVMLAEMNGLYVSVRFPSTHALRTYFTILESGGGVHGKKYPDLDEQFVMGLKFAKVVLARKILPPEFQDHGRLRSFWLLSSPIVMQNPAPAVINENSSSRPGQASVNIGGKLNSSLNCDGLLNWGVRRRITFKLKTPRVPSMSSFIRKENQAKMTNEIKEEAPTNSDNRKRKRASFRQKKKSKPMKRSSQIPNKKLKLSYNRWSEERYTNAEGKMLEIMKDKGAVIGNPISRPALRLEARKHIGDTGLLDHLLKHMAGKVAPNGEDRFRRRHNADGAMEYWLESVDLIDIRKEAGVNDSYWAPPPGWKPGDSLSLHPNSAREMTLLKEEITTMRRDMEELLLWKREHFNVDKAIEQHLLQISTSLKVIEEEMRKQAPNSKAENDKREINEEEKRAAKIERLRSGFRVCKPQGTFLWPNMGNSCCSSSTVNSNSVLVQDGTAVIAASESLVMICTPPSVTSLPILLPPTPAHSISLVRPLPEKRPTPSSLSTTCEQGDNMDMSTLFLKDNQNGFSGTPTSCTCTTTPLVAPSASMAGGDARSTGTTERTYRRKLAMQH